MTKKLLILGLLLTLVFTLNGCYSDDPSPFDDKATEVPISSFSESSEETTEETLEADVTETTQSQATETSTQEETEYSKDIAETSTTTVSTKTETPKSDDTEKVNKPEITTKPEENQQPTTQNEPEEKPKVEIVPNATSSDSKIVAQKVLEYINSYRSSPATKLSGLTEYAEYRSRQLIGNFAHDTDDERAAATALSYQDKKTMTVRDMSRILGLGKTASYRLIGQNLFKKFLVFGKIRIDVESFEEWYANQFHYKKVNGERPGKNHGKTVTPLTVAKVLGIPRSTANDLMNNGIVDFIWVDGHRHISRESFEKWYASQDKYKKVMEIEEVEDYVD